MGGQLSKMACRNNSLLLAGRHHFLDASFLTFACTNMKKKWGQHLQSPQSRNGLTLMPFVLCWLRYLIVIKNTTQSLIWFRSYQHWGSQVTIWIHFSPLNTNMWMPHTANTLAYEANVGFRILAFGMLKYIPVSCSDRHLPGCAPRTLTNFSILVSG